MRHYVIGRASKRNNKFFSEISFGAVKTLHIPLPIASDIQILRIESERIPVTGVKAVEV